MAERKTDRLNGPDRLESAIRAKHGLGPSEAPRRGRRPHEPAHELDELDVRILRALNQNARKSLRDLSRELDIALSTASARVKKLEESGVIEGYIPVLDPAILGFDLTVLIGVKIQHGKLLAVQSKIARNPHVFGVYDTTGEYDSLILARFRDRKDLDNFVKDLSATANIERTMTQLVLNTVKEERRVLL